MRSQKFTMRGKKRKEFIDYFEKIGESREELPEQETRFEGKGWTVTVGPESEVKIGTIGFPEVPVTITCEDDSFDAFVREYRLKFMTAGG